MWDTPVFTREVMGTMVSGEVPAQTRRRGAMVQEDVGNWCNGQMIVEMRMDIK